jgi:UDP-N-acetylmuramoyl-L-alanyl-D-glutamate--2,6-diaminopimelate ligase
MRLKELIQYLPATWTRGELDREFFGVTSDAGQVRPGMIYVVVSPQVTYEDMHHAVVRGASAIISEQGTCDRAGTAQIRVSDARAAMAKAAIVYHANPGTKLTMIAVVGEEHRTAIAWVIKEMMELSGVKTGYMGSGGVRFAGREVPGGPKFCPEAAETQNYLAQMVRAGCKACVVEMPPSAVLERKILGMSFDQMVFTPEYPAGVDNPVFSQATKMVKTQGKIFHLTRQNKVWSSGVPALEITRSRFMKEGSEFELREGTQKIKCSSELAGRPSATWTMAGAAVARATGIKWALIQNAISQLRPVPGHLEKVEAIGLALQPCTVFLERVRTDGELISALTTVREMTNGRLFLVVGCSGDRSEGEMSGLGRTAALLADFTIFTSDNPGKRNPAEIVDQMAGAYRAVRALGCDVVLERTQAIRKSISLARTSDTILIAGKGAERFDERDGAVVPYDDAEEVRSALFSERLTSVMGR